jgi:hypothetical protein
VPRVEKAVAVFRDLFGGLGRFDRIRRMRPVEG